MLKIVKDIVSNPAGYSKFLVALGAALAVLASALSDGQVSASEWVAIASAFLGSGGVYQVTNKGE